MDSYHFSVTIFIGFGGRFYIDSNHSLFCSKIGGEEHKRLSEQTFDFYATQMACTFTAQISSSNQFFVLLPSVQIFKRKGHCSQSIAAVFPLKKWGFLIFHQ